MNIVEKKLSEIKPYEKNPRKNDEAVIFVANSIKEFGFKVPIVIDKDGVIVAGHTRYKAAKQLGLKTVPCTVADDLTDEQIKAYRLADNKVSEKALWDYELLDEELADILDINMEDFDFTPDTIDWASVEDLSEDTYKEPDAALLKCPFCSGIDVKVHFVKPTKAEADQFEKSKKGTE